MRSQKSVTYQMFTEDIHNVLVYIFQEADSKMGLDVQALIGGSIWE